MPKTTTKMFASVFAVATSVLLALANTAHATTISFTINNYVPGYIVNRTVDGVNFFQTDLGYFIGTRTTGGNFTGTLLGPSSGNFIAWCIEPREFISVGSSYTYDVNPLSSGTTNIGGMGAQKAQALNDLFGAFYPDFRAPITDLQGAALQAATWEIVREAPANGWNLTAGNVRYTATAPSSLAALALAQTYLDTIAAPGSHPQPTFGTLALTKVGGSQDIIVEFIPEPESLALFLIGGSMLAISRRRRLKPA